MLAKASLTSNKSTSSRVMPARARALGIATDGPCEQGKTIGPLGKQILYCPSET